MASKAYHYIHGTVAADIGSGKVTAGEKRLAVEDGVDNRHDVTDVHGAVKVYVPAAAGRAIAVELDAVGPDKGLGQV